MKKKSLLLGAAMMLAGAFAFTSCSADDIVDNLTVCTECVENTTQVSGGEFCSTTAAVEIYENELGSGWTCTRK